MRVHTHKCAEGPWASVQIVLAMPATGWDAGAHFLGGIWGGSSLEAGKPGTLLVQGPPGLGADGWGRWGLRGDVAICHTKSLTNSRVPLD